MRRETDDCHAWPAAREAAGAPERDASPDSFCASGLLTSGETRLAFMERKNAEYVLKYFGENTYAAANMLRVFKDDSREAIHDICVYTLEQFPVTKATAAAVYRFTPDGGASAHSTFLAEVADERDDNMLIPIPQRFSVKVNEPYIAFTLRYAHGKAPHSPAYRHLIKTETLILREDQEGLCSDSSSSEIYVDEESRENYERAMGLLRGGHITEAAGLLYTAANEGHADAMFELGNCYASKDDDQEYAEKKIVWYKKAAQLGHAGAMLSLGDWYKDHAFWHELENKDDAYYKKAHYWFVKAAETGSVLAMYSAGLSAGHGISMEEKDWLVHDYWMLKAAETGHIDAMESVASRYENGRLYIDGKQAGPDEYKSAYWHEKAAEKGHVWGMHSTWKNNSLGSGVEKDMEKAAYWLMKSAEHNYTRSQIVLADMYYNGEWFEPDKEKAAYWYERAADLVMASEYLTNDEYEMVEKLVRMYRVGDGIPQDAEKAELLSKSLKARGQGILS